MSSTLTWWTWFRLCLAKIFMIFWNSESFTYLIYIPTRVTPTSANCLHHVSVNFLENLFSNFLQAFINDHFAKFCCVPIWIGRKSKVPKHQFRNPSKENIPALRNDLSNRLNIFNSTTLNFIIEKLQFKFGTLKPKLWQLRNYLSLVSKK